MGTVTVGEVRFHAHPGDHNPRHVHAKIGSGEVVIDLLDDGKVALSPRKRARKNVTDSEVRKALNAADAAYKQLVILWEKAH
jgi:hypothetical protein